MTDAIKRAAEFPHPLPWPHEPTEIVKEAVRDYVGDGDGMDAAVIAAHDRAALTAALSDREGMATNILSTILRSKEDPNSGRLALEIRDALVAHLIGGEGA